VPVSCARYAGINGKTHLDRFEAALHSSNKYDIKLICQLDFVYFRPEWNVNQFTAKTLQAAHFIKKYNNLISRFSGKEKSGGCDLNARNTAI